MLLAAHTCLILLVLKKASGGMEWNQVFFFLYLQMKVAPPGQPTVQF